jgi:hypothetical protein
MTVCICITILGLLSASRGQALPHLDDPLFGVDLNPQQLHLEIAPSIIQQRCQELRGRKLWVFAHSRTGNVDYYILSGYLEHPDSKPPSYEPDFGVGAVLDGTSCTAITAERLISGEFQSAAKNNDHIPDAVIDSLASDALRRMTVAFGGKEHFKTKLLKAVEAHDAYEARLPPSLRSDYPPILRKHIEEYLK